MIATHNLSKMQVFKALNPFEIKSEKKTDETTILVHLIKSKSEFGFATLYDKYCNALYRALLKIVKRTEVAEDLLQDTFVKIWKNIDKFDHSKRTLYTWMLNIARNQAIDYMRSPYCKNQLQNISIDQFPIHPIYATSVQSNNNNLDFKDFRAKALKIDQKYAEVIDVIFFLGYTHKQTAKLLNLPLGTVKTRARKGLSMLKILYEP